MLNKAFFCLFAFVISIHHHHLPIVPTAGRTTLHITPAVPVMRCRSPFFASKLSDFSSPSSNGVHLLLVSPISSHPVTLMVHRLSALCITCPAYVYFFLLISALMTSTWVCLPIRDGHFLISKHRSCNLFFYCPLADLSFPLRCLVSAKFLPLKSSMAVRSGYIPFFSVMERAYCSILKHACQNINSHWISFLWVPSALTPCQK